MELFNVSACSRAPDLKCHAVWAPEGCEQTAWMSPPQETDLALNWPTAQRRWCLGTKESKEGHKTRRAEMTRGCTLKRERGQNWLRKQNRLEEDKEKLAKTPNGPGGVRAEETNEDTQVKFKNDREQQVEMEGD